MKRASAGVIARELERLCEPGTIAGLSEPQVLARFVERGDPVAFEAIVVRHGPAVLSVCRGLLRDANDVDDAFQATFVILMRKAAGLKHPDRLGAWLYGVAHRVASRSRRRRRAEGLPRDVEGPAGGPDAADVEQMATLHDEIGRLPEKYRLPIVMCCVQEETHDEAARKLGWPVGTVHGRLSRGRDLLRGRLVRRGVLVPEVVTRPAGAAPRRLEKSVPEPLLRSTLGLLAGPIPTQLQTLAGGVLSAMFTQKLRSAGLVAAMTTLGVASAATALLAYQQPATKSQSPAANAGPVSSDARVKKALGKAGPDSFGPAPVDGAADGAATTQRTSGLPRKSANCRRKSRCWNSRAKHSGSAFSKRSRRLTSSRIRCTTSGEALRQLNRNSSRSGECNATRGVHDCTTILKTGHRHIRKRASRSPG